MLSDLSYLRYPLPPDVQRLFEAGDFERMARVIAMRLEDPHVPAVLRERLRFQLSIAREIPAAYPHTRPALLAMLQEQVKDFTEAELEALRDDGTLDWRYVNGEVRFKDNCVASLLKTRAEYAARALDPSGARAAQARHRALDEIIAFMKANGGARARIEVHDGKKQPPCSRRDASHSSSAARRGRTGQKRTPAFHFPCGPVDRAAGCAAPQRIFRAALCRRHDGQR